MLDFSVIMTFDFAKRLRKFCVCVTYFAGDGAPNERYSKRQFILLLDMKVDYNFTRIAVGENV